MDTAAHTLDRLIARVGQLYSLPAVAMEVLRLTNHPKVDTRALKECIENDPALTGKILRVVNSALFGLSREVSDLNQALALLGSKPLKLLVLGFSLPSGLFADVAAPILERYWRHTLTKAVAGRELAETLWCVPGDDAFIAGLLQDLGILVLIQELGEPYVKLLERTHARDEDMASLEFQSLGFDHTAVTARLLADWGLPPALVEAVGWKTEQGRLDGPPRAEQTLPQILHLSELLAQLLADEHSEVLGEILDAGRAYQGLSEARLETIVDSLEEKVRQLADVLSLQLPGELEHRDVLIQAHAQLAQVATEAAGDLLAAGRDGAQPADEDLLLGELRGLAKAMTELSSQPPPENRRDPSPASASKPAGPESAPAVTTTAAGVRTVGRTATGIDPGLLGQLTAAVGACRQARCPLSLLLVKLNHVDELMITLGEEGLRDLGQLLERICRAADHPYKKCLPHGETGFALILPDCERRGAIELGSQLIAEVSRRASGGGDPAAPPVQISAGVATVALPPKNFPAGDLFSGAERCLYGSGASGGTVVKSIEIY